MNFEGHTRILTLRNAVWECMKTLNVTHGHLTAGYVNIQHGKVGAGVYPKIVGELTLKFKHIW